MRYTKFRGKSIETGAWVDGDLVTDINAACSIIDYANHKTDTYTWTDVDPETVGQWTGLNDSKGVEIYEGDIITFVGGNSIQTMGENSDIKIISVLEATKQLGWTGSGYTFCEANCNKLVEVIGNIHENPELQCK